MSAFLALFSSATYGISDFFGGQASRRVPAMTVVVWTEIIGLASAILAGLVSSPWSMTLPEFGWSAGAGIVGAGGFVLLFEGLSRGRMAVVSPLSALVGAGLPVLVGLLIGERPGTLAWLGIGLALPAMWLVSYVQEEARGKSGIWYGLFAGVLFGLFFVMMSRTPSDAGVWPVAVARFGAPFLTVPLAFLRRISLRWPSDVGKVIVGVGIADIAANMLYLVAVRGGMLSLVAVLTSLYPAFTVVLARLVAKEHMTRAQISGVGLALLASALIAI